MDNKTQVKCFTINGLAMTAAQKKVYPDGPFKPVANAPSDAFLSVYTNKGQTDTLTREKPKTATTAAVAGTKFSTKLMIREDQNSNSLILEAAPEKLKSWTANVCMAIQGIPKKTRRRARRLTQNSLKGTSGL